MRLPAILRSLVLLLVLLTTLPAFATPDAETVVKNFYAKIRPLKNFSHLSSLKNYFDPMLYRLLLQDQKNREKNTGEICGSLDFDPFFNTQDERRAIKNIKTIKPDFVAVTFSGDTKPNVLVKLKKINNERKIINFIYPNVGLKKNRNLILMLKTLQQDKC